MVILQFLLVREDLETGWPETAKGLCEEKMFVGSTSIVVSASPIQDLDLDLGMTKKEWCPRNSA